jgi:hypothetical protein
MQELMNQQQEELYYNQTLENQKICQRKLEIYVSALSSAYNYVEIAHETEVLIKMNKHWNKIEA